MRDGREPDWRGDERHRRDAELIAELRRRIAELEATLAVLRRNGVAVDFEVR